MGPKELLERIKAGTSPAIVDVRSPGEFSAGHVPGAVNLPLPALLAGDGPPAEAFGEPLVLYCGHGPRAYLAAAALRARGFRRIRFLRGHMAGWRRAGLPEERE